MAAPCVPAALSAFVAGLGLLPYLTFARQQGSLKPFKSAFDEDSYLLNSASAPYRFLSGASVGVIDVLTPGMTGLLITADVLIPILVVISTWMLATRLVGGAGPRLLCALLLLFGQELFRSRTRSSGQVNRSSAYATWLLHPTTLKLFPDATTSYFGLFRTPEPAVSWVLLFGFLALISGPDPLAAFEGRWRRLTYPIAALLGFAYPFSSGPDHRVPCGAPRLVV